MPEITELTDDELLSLYEESAVELAEFDQRTAYMRYVPYVYQRKWHMSQAPIVLVLCANQVGKSTAATVEAVRESTGVDPPSLGGSSVVDWPVGNRPGWRVLILGDSLDRSVRQTLVPKLKEFVSPEMLASSPRMHLGLEVEWHFKSGATLIFGSYEQSRRIFEGPQWNLVICDEPPPKDIWQACQRGTMKRRGRMMVTATPLSEPWLWDELYIPSLDPDSDLYKRVDYFRVDMHEACKEHHGGHLPHDEIMALLATLSDAERAARAHGQFLAFQNLAFHYVTEATHVVPNFELPADWPVIEVCDPSMTRGLYLGWFTCSPEDEWYWYHAAHVRDGAFAVITDDIKRQRRILGREPDMAIMDARGGAHIVDKHTEQTWFSEFRNYGLSYLPSVETRIQKLHDWLELKWNPETKERRSKLHLCRSLLDIEKGPMWAFERFVWNPMLPKKQQYVQAGKDWIDLARYLSGYPLLSWDRLSRSANVVDRRTRRGPILADTYSRRSKGGKMTLGSALRRQALQRRNHRMASWVTERTQKGYGWMND